VAPPRRAPAHFSQSRHTSLNQVQQARTFPELSFSTKSRRLLHRPVFRHLRGRI